jgi:hypothetical protein
VSESTAGGADPVSLQRTTSCYWYVVNAATEGITFSISAYEPDARSRAEYWLRVCGEGHRLERREFEYWVSPTREISREVLA